MARVPTTRGPRELSGPAPRNPREAPPNGEAETSAQRTAPARASRRGAPGRRRAPGGATMHIKRQRGWEIPEHLATSEAMFLSRRSLLGGAAGLAAATAFDG